VAVWPLAVLIIVALGGVGIAAFLGWKVGNVIDALAKYIIPVTLIGVGGLVLAAYVMRPVAAKAVEVGPKYIEAARS
jgi:ABC-type dipeptide/oligopeptide/nickel transport system permease component